MSDSFPLAGYPLNGNVGVLAMAEIELVGDFVPHSWWRFIKNAKGRSDPSAIWVLARLVACYMPFQVDPLSWHALPGRKPAPGIYRIEFGDIGEYLRLSARQVRKALGLLQEHGLLRLHSKGRHGLHVEMGWERIISISFSTDGEVL